MNTLCMRLLSVALVLAMTFVLVPATAQKAEAADGDVTSDGYVLFEEDFNHASLAELKAEHNYYQTGLTPTIEDINGDKCLVYTNPTSNSNLQFTFSDLDIPGSTTQTKNRPAVAVLVEVTYKTEETGKVYATIGNIMSSGSEIAIGNLGYPSEATWSYTPNTGSNSAVCLMNSSNEMVTHSIGRYSLYASLPINSFTLQVGCRKDGGKVMISHVKVSLILTDRGSDTILGVEMVPYLAKANGYFKLPKDLENKDGSSTAQDLTLGTNAVLDLNGYTLTIPAGKKLVVGSNAKIVDTSVGKTGKIVADEGAITILNQDHPSFPIYTGDGYIFTEPKLEIDKQMRFKDVSGLGFTLHFRPGFGTDVRENYLSNAEIDTGVQMTATLSWVDANDGTGSKDLACDDMFKQMYLTQTSRGELKLTGAENYKSITLTITLTSCEVSKRFVVTFENDYVHMVNSQFYMNGTETPAFTNAVGNEGVWVLDCNLAYTGEKANHFSVRVNTSKGTFTLFASQYEGGGTKLYTGMKLSATPTKVHMEVDLSTGAYYLALNGTKVAEGTNTDLAAGLPGVSQLVTIERTTEALGCETENSYEVTDLVIYTKLNSAT